MIWVLAVVLGLSVLAMFTGMGVTVWRLRETQCGATAFSRTWPGLLMLGAVVASSASSYVLALLTQAAA